MCVCVCRVYLLWYFLVFGVDGSDIGGNLQEQDDMRYEQQHHWVGWRGRGEEERERRRRERERGRVRG